MAHTICTFNVNNLYLRYKFGKTFPGDISGKSLIAETEEAFGYLPLNNPGAFDIFNPEQRSLAGKALRRGGNKCPDVVCFQEVESVLALRAFNENHLGGAYKHTLLIDGRDLRQIDVGILSKLEIARVRSNMDYPDPKPGKKDPYLFSRDCLEVEVELNKSGSKRLTLFVNHLKSKLSKSAAERKKGDQRRLRQAAGVANIIKQRFPGQAFYTALFAVVGDMNDEPKSEFLAPLLQQAGLANALERIPHPPDRWTHWYRSGNSVSQLDHLLLSPALDQATQGELPHIERRGISFGNFLQNGKPGPKKTHYQEVDNDPHPVDLDFQFDRFADVNPDVFASDHCPVFLDVP